MHSSVWQCCCVLVAKRTMCPGSELLLEGSHRTPNFFQPIFFVLQYVVAVLMPLIVLAMITLFVILLAKCEYASTCSKSPLIFSIALQKMGHARCVKATGCIKVSTLFEDVAICLITFNRKKRMML